MIVTQYYPNPLFHANGAKHQQSGNGSMIYEYGDQKRCLYLESGDDQGMQCSLPIDHVPTGEPLMFQFSAYISKGANSFRDSCICTIGHGSWVTDARIGDDYKSYLDQTHVYSLYVTIPSGTSDAKMIFNSPSAAGEYVIIDNPFIMTETDWTRFNLMSDRPERLYGDLMPKVF